MADYLSSLLPNTGTTKAQTPPAPSLGNFYFSTGRKLTAPKTPSVNLQKLATKWDKRYNTLVSMKGVDFQKHVMPIINLDKTRVKQGKTSYSDAQVIDMVTSLAHGKPLISPKPPSGFSLGNVVKDIGGLAEGVGTMITHPVQSLENIAKNPLQMIPGYYTLSELAQGNLGEIEAHPISHFLDVLPYMAITSKLAVGARLGESLDESTSALPKFLGGTGPRPAQIRSAAESGQLLSRTGEAISKGSSQEALALGHPLKALSRSTGLSDVIGKGTSALHVGEADRAVNSKLAALQQRTNNALEAGKAEMQRLTVDMPISDRIEFYKQITAGQGVEPKFAVLAQQVTDHINSVANSDIAAGRLFEWNGEQYAIKGDVHKAFLDYMKTAKKAATTHNKWLNTSDPLKRLNLSSKRDAQIKEMQVAQDRLNQVVKDKAPARFREVAIQKRNQAVIERLRAEGHSSPEVEARVMNNDFAGILDKNTLKTIFKDQLSQWQDWKQAGINPVYIPQVPGDKIGAIEYARILPVKGMTESYLKDYNVMSMKPGVMDVSLALTSMERDTLRVQASEDLVKWLESQAVPETKVHELVSGATHKLPAVPGVHARDIKVQEGWRSLNAIASPYINKDRLSALVPNAKKLYVPRAVADALDRSLKTMDHTGLRGVYDQSIDVFRFAVLTTPRHLVHVMASSAMFMMGDYGPLAYRNLPAALDFVKAANKGEIAWPEELSRGLNYDTAPQWHEFMQARTMGRWLRESKVNPVRFMKNLEEKIADTHRIMMMLEGERKGLTRSQALWETNRYMMDFHSYTPLERTTIRNIVPFYAFTRQILRYMLVLPADHPIRASILANLIEMEGKDQSTGLPNNFQTLFFLGTPDQQGNVSAVDLRNLNPFRSIGLNSPFTLAGLTSGLNPYLQSLLTVTGVNPLTATPDLYPNLTVDPNTGNIVAKHDIKQIPYAFIPQLNILSSAIGWNQQLANLKRTNPASYQKALLSYFGVPFVPTDVNPAKKRAQYAYNLYTTSQKDVSAAKKAGDVASLNYDYVPYQGNIMTPAQLQAALGAKK